MHCDERIIPEKTDKGIVSVHLKRYDFARNFCRDRMVLDLGCGVGYGSAFLASEAAKVIGVDFDQDAANHAHISYTGKNVEYMSADGEKLPFRDQSFDVVCSLETIEHVSDAKACLRNVARILKPEGVFVVSTPLASSDGRSPENPHHHQEWDSKEFQKMLEAYFSKVEIWYQTRKQTWLHGFLKNLDVFHLRSFLILRPMTRLAGRFTRTVPFFDLRLEDLEIQSTYSRDALSQIGVCRGVRPLSP